MRKTFLPLMLGWAMFLIGGCATERYSGRYSGGSKYTGIGDVKTFRKFYVRNDVAFVMSGGLTRSELHKRMPELFNREPESGDIPIDIVVEKGVPERSGDATPILSGLLLGIIPFWTSEERTDAVNIVVNGDAKMVSQKECHFSYDMKGSIFSPLGWIPYFDKEGYQRNETGMGIITALSYTVRLDIEKDILAKCLAQQLKMDALGMLMTPDVNFDVEME